MRPIFVASAALIAAGALYLLRDSSTPSSRNTAGRPHPAQKVASSPPPASSLTFSEEQGQRSVEPRLNTEEIDRIRALILAAGPLQRGRIRNDETIALLHRLAEIAPAEAIVLAVEQEGIHGDHALPGELFASWLDRSAAIAEQWFTSLTPGEIRSRVAPEFISLLVSQQPERALTVLDTLQGEARTRSLAALFNEWSDHDPRAAAAYALRLPIVGYERSLALASVAEKWAQSDLSSAVAWLSQLSSGGDREAALNGLLPEWAARNPAQAAGIGGIIPDNSSARGEWLRTIAEHWITQDADAAIRWVQGLAKENERDIAIRAAAITLAEEGNAEAADRLLKLPPGDVRQAALETVLNQWAAADLGAVANWCVKLPPGQLRDALQAFGPIWAVRDPGSLAPVVAQVLDKGLRENLTSAVADAWATRQPAAAGQWAIAKLSGHEQVQALRRIVPVWANRDLTEVGAWVNGMQPGPARDLTVELLSTYMAPKYPEAAAEWANSIANENQREAQMQSLFELWADRDPTTARRWFGDRDRVVKP